MAQETNGVTRRILIIVTEGSEDVEVAIPSYIFRSGGVETVIASVDGSDRVRCCEGLTIIPDMSLEEASKKGPFDAVFLPGGVTGAPNLAKSELLGDILKEQEKREAIVAAICYSPALCLTKFGIYKGRKITCYPRDHIVQVILDAKTHVYVDECLVQDGPLITAQGPAFAIPISLAIVEKLCGSEKATEVSNMMLLHKKISK